MGTGGDFSEGGKEIGRRKSKALWPPLLSRNGKNVMRNAMWRGQNSDERIPHAET